MIELYRRSAVYRTFSAEKVTPYIIWLPLLCAFLAFSYLASESRHLHSPKDFLKKNLVSRGVSACRIHYRMKMWLKGKIIL